jgi:hypothetical protein
MNHESPCFMIHDLTPPLSAFGFLRLTAER